ncbi:KRAB-A domain-containing protein 2-like [Anthonomus grandis grandis]|uniref:KRAB-A domain-containing protein 2-like n=1 Tax=Anthonomus grandis grandis TaxID=2921223 RepID=UPI0021651237|nr:KRAB-A domain-containing protein 2-like [Anthonomus grandis grandis]
MNGETCVIKKVSNQGDPVIYIISEEDIYKRLKDIHVNCGHGSRDKMINLIQQNCSIPKPCIEMFLKACETGEANSNSFFYDSRTILNFQDHATKYICIRPLRSKHATEVAQELIKIFLQFGAPSILQCDNGREFACKIIEELKLLWPQLHILHGRPRHPQSQGSVERANQDVENMIRVWLRDNNTTAWSAGCYFVQWQKNNSLHRVIGRTPFKAVFGSDSKLGLQSTSLPPYMVPTISTEEELEELTNELNANQENPEYKADSDDGLEKTENNTALYDQNNGKNMNDILSENENNDTLKITSQEQHSCSWQHNVQTQLQTSNPDIPMRF